MSPRPYLRDAYVRDAVVIGAATGVFGMAFGVLAATTGLTVPQTMAMSLLVFTGASQFAAVGVIGAGGGEPAALGSALLLAARNGFYGIALAQHLRSVLWRRVLGSQLIIDESTALSLAQEDSEDRPGAFWAGGLAVFFFWNLGTVVGAVGGDAIGDPEALGLDAAFPAGFIALAAPAFGHRRGVVAAAVGAAIAVAATPFVRPGLPILFAAAGALVALAVPESTGDGPAPSAPVAPGQDPA
ncbi:MAG: AzlC family ABC transporter permease [Actinomycetota bacterium]